MKTAKTVSYKETKFQSYNINIKDSRHNCKDSKH